MRVQGERQVTVCNESDTWHIHGQHSFRVSYLRGQEMKSSPVACWPVIYLNRNAAHL